MPNKTIKPKETSSLASHNVEIIGQHYGLRDVFNLVKAVAPTGSAVLLQGETGTGKELIAAAIHQHSGRASKEMVKVNCAALSPQLIESELFGHEKGSFTGAIEKRVGKFEAANESTILLDEIGEMSAPLQVKLLRVLQEQEIERIGGNTTIKINVRIIAATNQDLSNAVSEGRFRADLFYRLNVFPISILPLRERKQDIPLLVSYFLALHAYKTKEPVKQLSQAKLKQLMQYSWPGNVRELEHVIERSILVSSGNKIKEILLPSLNKQIFSTTGFNGPLRSLRQYEKDYIIHVLEVCNGKIRGKGAAAEILKIPPTTLHSKIKKLGIVRSIVE